MDDDDFYRPLPGMENVEWQTDELVEACRCNGWELSDFPDEWSPGSESRLLQCSRCKGWERFYVDKQGNVHRGLLGSLLEMKERKGIIVPAIEGLD